MRAKRSARAAVVDARIALLLAWPARRQPSHWHWPASASVSCSRHVALRARAGEVDRPRTPPHCRQPLSTWFMSEISACVAGRAHRHLDQAARQRRPNAPGDAKAPLPTFTSITSASRPAASFLDGMLAVISGTDSTVAVTSRMA